MTREMRALLLEMRSTHLEHRGLLAALEDLAASYRDRLDMTVNTIIEDVTLDAQCEHTLLRIAQEAFLNAARHADATTITLSLVPQQDTIALTITDNGKGFSIDEDTIPSYGLGLRLMQERVNELRGTFLLTSSRDQGTRIQVYLPQENCSDSRIDCR